MTHSQSGPQFSTAAAELALRYSVVLTFSHVGATLLAAAALWDAVPRAAMVWWLSAAGLAALVHAAAVWWGRRARGGRYLWFVLGVAVVAAAWGLAGLLLFSSHPLHQAMLTVIAFTVAVVALLVLAAFARLYAFFLALALTPLLLRLALEGDRIHLVMAASAATMALALLLLGYALRGTLRSWFILRARNQMLVDDLRLQKDAAEQANVAKSRFLAAASHDLRQPLHALSLFSTALSERIRYPEVRRIVDNIMASVAALESLFNALLDISKLDAGALQPQWRSVALAQLLSRLDNDYRPQAEAKGLSLSIAEAPELYVRSDPALLERMLRNLVANGVRYTDRGAITVDWELHEQRVCIAVRDTGIGIAADDLDQIFDEFVQLQNPERDRSKGLGLGLAIVQRLSAMLEHPVSVRSTPGQGSTFTVTVPRAEAVQSPPESVATRATPPMAGMTVLVVDDDATNCEAMATLLTGWGCKVVCADGLVEALGAAQSSVPIDCVIADYRLREGCTGVEVIASLEEAGCAAAVLVLTGDPHLAQQGQVGEKGYRLMHKPANPARLRAFLGHVAARRRRETTAP